MDAAGSSSNFAASSSTDAASSSAVEEITLADVCAFLEASSDSFAADLSAVTDVPVRLPPPMPSGQVVDYHPRAPSTAAAARGGPAAAVVDGAGSHVCTWPQCGKGFASRWALERHQRNHSNHDSEAHDADSFVERRLRERLRGLQQQLERTREKLGTQLLSLIHI